jgi:hypothetical protein
MPDSGFDGLCGHYSVTGRTLEKVRAGGLVALAMKDGATQAFTTIADMHGVVSNLDPGFLRGHTHQEPVIVIYMRIPKTESGLQHQMQGAIMGLQSAVRTSAVKSTHPFILEFLDHLK